MLSLLVSSVSKRSPSIWIRIHLKDTITTAYLLRVPGFSGDGRDVVHKQVRPGQNTQQRCRINQRPHFIQPADHLHKTLFRKECDANLSDKLSINGLRHFECAFQEFSSRRFHQRGVCLVPKVWLRWRWPEEGGDPACVGPWQAETTAACLMSGSKRSPSSSLQWGTPGAGASPEQSTERRG